MKKQLALLLVLFVAFGCSQFNQGPASKSWHNLNAKYNILIFGEDKLKFVKQTLERQRSLSFNEVLPIFEPIDSTKLDTLKPYLEEVVRLSSKLAEKHSNSKYLDDAYLLLGKARLYKGETFAAMETFKYVNANATSEIERNTSKIWLLRSYIEDNDYRTAEQVSGLISKANLSKKNAIDFYLVKAFYHQKIDELPVAVVFLDEAIKLMPKNQDKARCLFIAGQLYQKINRSDLASKRYQEVKKNNPPYELEFNAEANNLLIGKNTAQADQIFNKMLKEFKNEGFKDQIYLRKAKLNEKSNDYTKAIENYNLALKNTKSKAVRTDSYYSISKIELNEFKNYQNTALYLDSTLTVLDSTYKNYKEIKAEANYLIDFAGYFAEIQLQDSLQTLAKLPADQLNTKLSSIAEDKIKKLEEAEKNKVKAEQSSMAAFPTNDLFILYDPLKRAEGLKDFKRKWGTRELTDNWRISSKQGSSFETKSTLAQKETPKQSTEDEIAFAKEKQKQELVKELKEGLPLTELGMAESMKKLETAYFGLGKLYKIKLNENEKATESLTKLINQFPETTYRPEALYLLAISHASPKENKYSNEIIEKYPLSSYARLIKSGNIVITTDTENKAENAYKTLYQQFEDGNFNSALSQTNEALEQYIGSKVEDKLAFLRILLYSKLKETDSYKLALTDFINSYQDSNLKGRAKEMFAELTP